MHGKKFQNLILFYAGNSTMEQTPGTDTNLTEMPPPSLGEAMSKLLESMDPQGLLNEAYQEDGPTDDGVDQNKRGDEHAGQHVVSLSHSGSESGSGTEDESGEPAAENSRMEVEPPSYRIVDIEPPAMQTAESQHPAFSTPTQSGSAMPAMIPAMIPAAKPAVTAANVANNHTFAVPAEPTALRFKNIPGMNIFQNSSAEKTSENTIQNKTNLASNPVLNDSVSASESAAGPINPNLNKVPSGVKKPNFVNSLPPKKPDPIEPDAVPPKSYEAMIKNKKKKEKAGTIGGIASGQGPLECGSFYNKGDNQVLRSVYTEDVSSLSVSSMSFNPVTWKCTACPSSHSVFEANVKGGRTVIVLADQNFPAVLPSSENRCLSIIRLDQGGLDKLIDLFLKIARQTTVPAGTVVLFGSLISLSKVGLQSYAAACVNSKRRLTGGVKGIEAVPFVPPPPPGRLQ
jgi:hypothetical protein